MSEKNWSARTRRDLIIEVWEALDCESVGARELEQIQQALGERFGEGALESPAAIARVVADEGAVLRHPEVFTLDGNWRERRLMNGGPQTQLDFTDLSQAFQSVVKLEEQRLELQAGNDAKGQTDLRRVVASVRKDLMLKARSRIVDDKQREAAKEVSQWLMLWLQTPELFSDWLDLRRRSPEFRKKFHYEEAD